MVGLLQQGVRHVDGQLPVMTWSRRGPHLIGPQYLLGLARAAVVVLLLQLRLLLLLLQVNIRRLATTSVTYPGPKRI